MIPRFRLPEKRRFLAAVAFCLSMLASVAGQAQNPGYVGRHTFATFGTSLPGLYPIIHDGGFPVHATATLGVALSTKWSLGAEYERLSRQTVYSGGGPARIYTNGSVSEYWGHQLSLQARKWSFKKHGSIAPMGRYIGFRIGAIVVNAETTFPIPPPPDTYIGRTEIDFITPFVGFFTGRQWIFADWIVLDVNGAVNLDQTMLTGFNISTGSDDDLSGITRNTVAQNQVIRLQVRIGGLLPM